MPGVMARSTGGSVRRIVGSARGPRLVDRWRAEVPPGFRPGPGVGLSSATSPVGCRARLLMRRDIALGRSFAQAFTQADRSLFTALAGGRPLLDPVLPRLSHGRRPRPAVVGCGGGAGGRQGAPPPGRGPRPDRARYRQRPGQRPGQAGVPPRPAADAWHPAAAPALPRPDDLLVPFRARRVRRRLRDRGRPRRARGGGAGGRPRRRRGVLPGVCRGALPRGRGRGDPAGHRARACSPRR